MTPGSPAELQVPVARRSASQAPPDQMPTRLVPGCSSLLHAFEEVAIQRLGVEKESCSWMFSEELFEDQRGGRGVHILGAITFSLDGGVTLVHLVHRQVEAALQLAAEAACAQRSSRARHRPGGRGTPMTRAFGLPFLDQLFDQGEIGGDGLERFGGAGETVACCDADALSYRSRKARWLMRDPASMLSMRGSTPSRAEGLVVAVLDRGVEDDLGGGVHGEPAVAADLFLELAGGPAAIAQGDQQASWGRRRWTRPPARRGWWSSPGRRGRPGWRCSGRLQHRAARAARSHARSAPGHRSRRAGRRARRRRAGSARPFRTDCPASGRSAC